MLPAGASLVSSEGVKKDSVPGSYSLSQKIKWNGKPGRYILYACPGKSGSARLMTMIVEDSNIGDLFAGAMFAERVCKKEPKGEGGVSAPKSAPSQTQAPKAPAPRASSTKAPAAAYSKADLAKLNAAIPAASRPRSAAVRLDQSFKGFPAVLVYEAKLDLTFPNGYTTSCANWDPSAYAPTPQSVGRAVKKCELTKTPSDGKKTRKFKPGETINIAFGRISATSTDGLNSASGTLSGGDLVISSDGRIAIGKFNIGHVESGGNSATSSRRSGLRGNYYLNGHTITIQTENGDVLHGFIAASSDKGSRKIDHVFINGEHYWNRKK